MAALYPVIGHPLLSDAALGLEAPRLDEQAALAEDLLGFTAPALTGTEAQRAKRAVALQVSYQVERGIEASVYESLGRGSRTFSYLMGAGLLHPVAAELAADLLNPTSTSGAFTTIQSLR